MQLDVSEVTGTLLHVLAAGGARICAVNGAELGVIQTTFAGTLLCLVLRKSVRAHPGHCIVCTHHSLRVDDVSDTHLLNLSRVEQTKLDLLDALQRRAGRRKVQVRHGDGVESRRSGDRGALRRWRWLGW